MAIKRSPADFAVEEILTEELSARITPAPAPFALYRLAKESLATPEAAASIARRLGVPAGALAYAGLKDKHARTVQHLTLKLGEALGAGPAEEAGPGWRIERVGWLAEPLTAEAIAQNRFRIVLRGLDCEACETMDQAAQLLGPAGPASPAGPGGKPAGEERGSNALVFTNYFGDQRFGSARHGQGFLARHLVKGEFEAALRLAIATPARKDRFAQKEFKRAVSAGWGDWAGLAKRLAHIRLPEARALVCLAQTRGDFRAAFTALPYFFQQLCVYAYQSHLWNAIARRLVAERCAPRGPVLEADDPFGVLLFPAGAAIPAELVSLQLPLLSRKTELREPWKEEALAVLAQEGLALEELRIPGVRRPFFGEAPRALFSQTSGFALSAPEPDETARGAPRFKRTLAFALPRGAYATVLLRALGQ